MQTLTVRDSLVNICPLRDFAYGLRSNGDASGLSKYELVRGLDISISCSTLGTNLHSRNRLQVYKIIAWLCFQIQNAMISYSMCFSGIMLWAWEKWKFICATSVNSTRAHYRGMGFFFSVYQHLKVAQRFLFAEDGP